MTRQGPYPPKGSCPASPGPKSASAPPAALRAPGGGPPPAPRRPGRAGRQKAAAATWRSRGLPPDHGKSGVEGGVVHVTVGVDLIDPRGGAPPAGVAGDEQVPAGSIKDS